jgi:hypothetical protein
VAQAQGGKSLTRGRTDRVAPQACDPAWLCEGLVVSGGREAGKL